MIKILGTMLFFQGVISQLVQGTLPVGGNQDANGCMIGAGYNWCYATKSCIRTWETPCSDNYDGCADCFMRQRTGENIACPVECDAISVRPMPLDPLPFDPPMPPPPVDPLPQACPDVMCMMYCVDGFQVDDLGCNMCSCLTPIPMTPPEIHDILVPTVPGECPIPYSTCSSEFVCPKVVEMTHCSRDGISGYTTYRLSLVITNPNILNIYAIYGDSQYGEHPMSFPPAWQGQNYGNTNLGGISDPLLAISSDAAYDSWVTIGITNGDAHNSLSSVGIDFQSWTETSGIYNTNGAVFLMDAGKITVRETEYVVAQITIPDNQINDVIISAQGKLHCSDRGNKECDHPLTWYENDITFHLEQPKIASPESPPNCASWFDGCNTCRVRDGNIYGCSMMMCFRQGNPHCLSFDIPLVNPFDNPSGH